MIGNVIFMKYKIRDECMFYGKQRYQLLSIIHNYYSSPPTIMEL